MLLNISIVLVKQYSELINFEILSQYELILKKGVKELSKLLCFLWLWCSGLKHQTFFFFFFQITCRWKQIGVNLVQSFFLWKIISWRIYFKSLAEQVLPMVVHGLAFEMYWQEISKIRKKKRSNSEFLVVHSFFFWNRKYIIIIARIWQGHLEFLVSAV